MARTSATLVARLIFAAVFGMAAAFKFADMGATAQYIAGIGFPAPTLFAWLAAFFELALVAAFLSGLYFSQAALLAAAYVLFLAFASMARRCGPTTRMSSASSSITSASSQGCCSRLCTGRVTGWF